MRCSFCGTQSGAPEWQAREHILWKNQYGYGVRVFCKFCGAWTDYRVIYLSEDNPAPRLVKQPTQNLNYIRHDRDVHYD